MNLRNVNLSTMIPTIPAIISYNNQEVKRYMDLFYNENSGILVVPLTTTGRVKGATGEFVNIIVDNLTVKNQYTNLYENSTTADYNWYETLIDPVFEPRDPCTATNYWPFENIPGYKVIDVNKPYYKIDNEYPLILKTNTLSQIVGIMCSSTLVGTDPFTILMDPDPSSDTYMQTYTIDTSYAGEGYIEFVATKYDASYGATWKLYKYAYEESGAINVGVSQSQFDSSIADLVDYNIIQDNSIREAELISFNYKTADYVIENTDLNNIIEASGTVTIYLPIDVSSGFKATIINVGDEIVTLDTSTDAIMYSLDSSANLRDQYSVADIVYKGDNIWYAFGNLK